MKLIKGVMIATAFFALQACAKKEKDKVDLYQVDSQFESYVSNFETVAAAQGRSIAITDLIVSFGSTPTLNETGVCEITEGETPRVTINERIWLTLDPMSQQEVIYHELGHCVIRRKHQTSVINVGGAWGNIPESIMYPYRIRGDMYEDHQAHYDAELFTKSGEF